MIDKTKEGDGMATAIETPANGEIIRHQSAPARQNTRLVVHDDGPIAHLLDTAKFEHMQRIATLMAHAPLMPDHLRLDRGKKPLPPEQAMANCLLVVNQAFRWGIDPFAAAPETYVVGQKLGFQGKLVAAVVNSRAGLARPLGVKYNSGKLDAFGAVIYGSRSGDIPPEAHELLQRFAESEDRTALNRLDAMGVLAIRITVGQAKTDNRMWSVDPEQKLFYTGATKWARRHAPEIMLGVVTDDDLDRIRMSQEHHESAALIPSGGTRSEQLASMLSRRTEETSDADEPASETEPAETEQHDEPERAPLKGMSYDKLMAEIKAAKNEHELQTLMDEISMSMVSGEITQDGATKLGNQVEIQARIIKG